MPPAPEARIGETLDDSLQFISVIGVGAYGVVYKAEDLYDGTLYAVKALCKDGLDAKQKLLQSKELYLHARVQSHPNILSLYRVLDTEDTIYVVLQYCPDGDLFTCITEKSLYRGNDLLIKHVFSQLISAVQHCHSVGIYHRDLKPENILVDDEGRTVYLADFGLATTDELSSDYGCGSLFYMSPECQRESSNPNALSSVGYQVYTPLTNESSEKPSSAFGTAPNDVWALGIILINLCCQRNPWKRACSQTDGTYRSYVQNPSTLLTILPISRELNSLLNRIFDRNPKTRIGLLELSTVVSNCKTFTRRMRPAPLVSSKYLAYQRQQQQEIRNLQESNGYVNSAYASNPHIGLPWPPTPHLPNQWKSPYTPTLPVPYPVLTPNSATPSEYKVPITAPLFATDANWPCHNSPGGNYLPPTPVPSQNESDLLGYPAQRAPAVAASPYAAGFVLCPAPPGRSPNVMNAPRKSL
ncbi:serine/threonine protein kinase Ran1/Pat1 [Schizosaccharomyces osmophilus]|uniref:Serine/threonine protein kinase Ran1/Pat1 n=1 Tax=Schizosaccharomyces osmophilus TaxID=2545709 RepID=A0AAE9W9Z9_9SCHI|nr:serine/threonine protein kinase Ran1/Pat1 [Schizosaccharomyces osmophilus]WBW72088.1 serine/threonine protein kinase Ran1/Pat1 [Schizosaccharomyces osmophilus]